MFYDENGYFYFRGYLLCVYQSRAESVYSSKLQPPLASRLNEKLESFQNEIYTFRIN